MFRKKLGLLKGQGPSLKLSWRSSVPKLSAFNAIVDLVKEIFSHEICISTDSPQKKGRGDYARLYEAPPGTRGVA